MEQNQQRNDELEIDLREIALMLWRRALAILLTGVLLALLAVIGTKLFVTPEYQASTSMYILAKQSDTTLTNSDLQTSSLLTNDYAELIKSKTVCKSVIAQLDLNITYDQLLEKVSVTVPTDTRILTISVTDPDPYLARDLANTIRDSAAQQIQNVMEVETVNVVDEADIPNSPISPNIMRNGMMGGILGCVLAVGVILVLYLTNDTIITPDDAERYLHLSILGQLPLDDGGNNSSRVSFGKNKKK